MSRSADRSRSPTKGARSDDEAPTTDNLAEGERRSKVQIGTVVVLRNAHGRSVPEDLKDVAATITEVDRDQNKISFVAAGKRQTWHLEGVDAVHAKPLAIDSALREWLQSAETKCGHVTKEGRFCPWPAPCHVHHKREGEAMMREDYLSRQMQRGLCDVAFRSGCVCTNVKGECNVHAPEQLRCSSMVEDDPNKRCWNYKQQESKFCPCHQHFPDLSVRAKAYGEECHRRSNQVCSLDEFLHRFYQTAEKRKFPVDKFLAYLKRMSGHDDIREVRHKEQFEPKIVDEIKRIVDLCLPLRDDARSHVTSVNQSLSDRGSPFSAEVTETGLVISCTLKGVRYELAQVASL